MKRLIVILSMFALVSTGCRSSFSSKYQKDTPSWAVAKFVENLNAGKYDEAVKLLNVNPIENGAIDAEDFKTYVDDCITKHCSVDKATVTGETPEDFDPETIKVDISLIFTDGSVKAAWVDAERVDGIWKVTTRGTLFPDDVPADEFGLPE